MRPRPHHAVSAHGSIIAAAETLNVTTSVVSQQLAKLASETGQTQAFQAAGKELAGGGSKSSKG